MKNETETFSIFEITVMMAETKKFHEALGKRIAQRRKELGLTQFELAERINATQKIITSYERATRQMPAWRLAILADALEISVQELLGERMLKKGRGQESTLQKQLERLKRLPRTEQKFVIRMLDGALAGSH